MAGALEPREAKDTLKQGLSSRDASSFRHCAMCQQHVGYEFISHVPETDKNNDGSDEETAAIQ